ncbi:MAG: HD domain-containing protein [Pseudobdellovibrio sp.]|nr:HD domain-containing protein [Pseudobdellovibrio sp.]
MVPEWEKLFEDKIKTVASSEDPAHDLNHFKRVVTMAKKLCAQEDAKLEVVVPAAWLHDLVIVPKNSPLRSQASKLSAVKALEFLREINYPQEFHQDIAHAIEGHSFSANIDVQTLEAKIVQDADRLDGLGAIGIARCFAVAGMLKRSFYQTEDPFCEHRNPDDQKYTIDHFYQKLFKTAEILKTRSGQIEGVSRVQYMKQYLEFLKSEII